MGPSFIGHGPDKGLRPYVPDVLLLENNGSYCLLGRDQVFEIKEGELASAEEKFKITRNEPMPSLDGMWPCVWHGRTEWFRLADESQVRAQTSKSLLAEAKSIKGDPHRVIEMIIASSAMAGVDLDSLRADLEQSVLPGESLYDAYVRNKLRKT